MPVRIRIRQKPWGFVVLWLVAILSVVIVAGIATGAYFYSKYARLIEQKLEQGPFARTSRLYATPQVIRVGDRISPFEVTAHLRQTGYGETRTNLKGWFHQRGDSLEIFPGPDSYFRQDPFIVQFAGGKVSRIFSVQDSSQRTEYQLEPELITNLFDRQRQKRQIVQFSEIPTMLVNAVVAVEDKRFFQHSGFDPLRILKAAYVDLKKGYRAEGASTLSMQLARNLWLTPEKTVKRKAAETLITLHLERTLSKEKIFEYYANNVDMGRRGTFQILGFGEASRAYFGKSMKNLTLAEAALLAGLIQRPSFTNPVRWPERAKSRRNIVLHLMRDNGYINDREYAVAAAEPVNTAGGAVDSNDAPYFVDFVNEWLQDQLQKYDFQTSSYRIYTTLDPRLQTAALEAVQIGIKEADGLLEKRRKRLKKPPEKHQLPQLALVALDAETGEVRALIGGRNYGMSQLNRALARRQPGSIFKPFVYAAAVDTAIHPQDGQPILTPLTSIEDAPTTFEHDGKPYKPNNYGAKFYGSVSLRTALSKSLNVPTVKVAEMVGYEQVADMAKKAGLTGQVGTPAVALGSYEATPLDMAGAYTVFTNQGDYLRPTFIRAIYEQDGEPMYESNHERRNVMDPRVAFVMVNMMEEVVRSGTAAGVRSRGFRLPAAGKTGTSHDAWFAGFTSKLICVVWVGFDDNTDMKLDGAKAALPVWTEFMKRAHQIREYRNPAPFNPPEGVTMINGCTGGLQEAFISGSEPVNPCGADTMVAGWEDFGLPATSPQTDGTVLPPRATERADSTILLPDQGSSTPEQKAKEKKEKKGIWNRIRAIFK